jgi:pyruvate dehydrogenase E2 component (dihydrolipoamide acetyltransferase)
MPTSVVMPQMGESIAEGTIVRWIKRVGDRVDRDEPLFEISTDKVDAEIPAPAAGVLTEIRAQEGETVPVDTVVAVIGDAEAVHATPPLGTPPAPPPTVSSPERAVAAVPAAGIVSGDPIVPADVAVDALRRQKSSPVVRRIARDHHVDIGRIQGTGIGGRVTRNDILAFLETGGPTAGAEPARVADASPGPAAAAPAAPAVPAFRPGEAVEIVPMSIMRRRIAEHMTASRRTSAHVHSVFEVDFLRVSKIREEKKGEYERLGVKLSYLPFVIKAAADALRAVPVVNASIDGDNIVYKKDINIGIAVALDWGLIVPVIRNADEMNLLGLTRAVVDLATRARAKQLRPEEVQGGTFSITNPGLYGALFGTPIISQPQVAILDVGAIEKRPVVVDDAIAIRPRAYLTLGFDHRLIDGAVADTFMSFLKKRIEEFDAAGS